MALTVLIVDDNATTLALNENQLRQSGYDVLTAEDGAGAMMMAEQKPDCIVLDVLLPDANGFELARDLRAKCDAPILFLTSCTADSDIVKGLSEGDDYMGKPYSFAEMTARVGKLIQRGGHIKNILDFGELVIHLDGRSAAVHGKRLLLTTREFDILLTLAERKNTPVSTVDLYRIVWQDEEAFTPHVVMVNISTLKKKLDRATGGVTYIVSKRGEGYTFIDPPIRSVLSKGDAAGI